MSAQYGRAAGAVVSAVQKTGTNRFHGVAYEFNRNRSFNASDFFANRQGSPKPKYIRNQFGGEIDGPVIRNRTFFAFGYDQISLKTGDELDVQVPTPQELSNLLSGAAPIAKAYLAKLPPLTSTALCPDQIVNVAQSVGHVGCVHVFNPVDTPSKAYYGKIDHNFTSNDRLG